MIAKSFGKLFLERCFKKALKPCEPEACNTWTDGESEDSGERGGNRGTRKQAPDWIAGAC